MENLLKTLKIEIYMANFTDCGKWWNFDLNDPFNRIYYIDSGKGMMYVNGRKYVLLPKRLYCIPAYSKFKCCGGNKMGQFWLHFSAKIDSTVEIFNVIEPAIEIEKVDEKDIKEKFLQLMKLKKKKDLKSIFEADTTARYLLAHFLPAKTKASSFLKVKNYVGFRPVIEYIEANLSRQLSLEELAQNSGLSPVYFSNSFSKTFKMPPVKYVNLKRIEKAKLLLAGSDNKLETIAEAVGFSDSFYFSKTFKKYAGCNPSEYRRRVFYPSK